MATLENEPTAAGELAAERFRLATDLALEGKSPYPNEAVFVAADLPELGELVARHARERRPVVLVYPDGDERFLLPLPAPSTWRAAIASFFRALKRTSPRPKPQPPSG